MVLSYQSAHEELHYVNRSGWLRAAVLGANDGIVSVSSLIVGVAAADPSPSAVLIAGGAGLVAGAMSMAAGEYVSVSSQSDIERSDIAREKQALIDTAARLAGRNRTEFYKLLARHYLDATEFRDGQVSASDDA